MRDSDVHRGHLISARIASRAPFGVWTPFDFLDLGARATIDKALQRFEKAGEIRRISRGLYDKPQQNRLTGQLTGPDYREVLAAIGRRDQARMLIDGMTAANDLGLTTAVPARVVIHTDIRRRSIHFGNLTLQFKVTAPSRLYWAGRPAMRIVQALYWVRDTLPTNEADITRRLRALLTDPTHGPVMRADLREGLPTLPAWMQLFLRDLLTESEHSSQQMCAGWRPAIAR